MKRKTPLRSYSTHKFEGLSPNELSELVFNSYKNLLQGREVKNEDKGILIKFNGIGNRKTTSYNITKAKACVIYDLEFALSKAKYNNWGEPEPKHIEKFKAIGFLNFKYECLIDGQRKSFRISVMLRSTGKFQYHLSENIKTKKSPNLRR